MRRAFAVALAAALASGTTAVGSASAESVTEAVDAALAHHPQVWRDQALSVAAEHAVEEAYSDFLPSIDLDASSGYELTSSPTTRGAGRGTVDMVRSEASARLTQLLFDFYGTSNRVAAAASDLEASNASLQATSERIARLATRLFLDVLSARERTALAEQNLADLTTVLELIRGRAEAGRAAEADLDQAVSRVALAKADLAGRRGDERAVTARFLENVGHIPGALERPSVPDYPEADDLDQALAVAMNRNPVAHSTTAQWEARRAEVEVARAAYFPRLDFEASTSYGNNIDGVRGDQADVQFLVRLTWALFDGFGNVARTRAASHEANAAWLSDAEARRSIREAVRVAFRALQTAEARYPQLRADADASTRTYEAYRQQYDVGQRSLLDLLDARGEMFTAQEAEVPGSYAILQAHYDLLFAMGRLLEHLDIVVFQDREQYREDRQQSERMAAADAAGLPQGAAMGFDDADWSGEVAVPGGLEFGSWLSDGGAGEKLSGPAGASLDAPGDTTAPDNAPAAAQTFRRDIDGIEVELVPAMVALPESTVNVLPASGLIDSVAAADTTTAGVAEDRAAQGAALDGVASEDALGESALEEAVSLEGLAAEPAESAVQDAVLDRPEVVSSLAEDLGAEDTRAEDTRADDGGTAWHKQDLLGLLGLAAAELAALPRESKAAAPAPRSDRPAR
ncbi:MAG: TolC family outer membrane protein [Kiloniellales bacterium]